MYGITAINTLFSIYYNCADGNLEPDGLGGGGCLSVALTAYMLTLLEQGPRAPGWRHWYHSLVTIHYPAVQYHTTSRNTIGHDNAAGCLRGWMKISVHCKIYILAARGTIAMAGQMLLMTDLSP